MAPQYTDNLFYNSQYRYQNDIGMENMGMESMGMNTNNTMPNNTKGPIIRTADIKDKVYLGLNIFCILYFFIPLIWICFYKNWYIIKQRNFALTMVGGIGAFLSAFSNLIAQNMDVSCAFSYYSSTIFSFISQICFVSRAFRLILLYKVNVYKVTELNQEKFIQKSKDGAVMEPNIYYKSIYKAVNKRVVYFLIPFLIMLNVALTIYLHRTIDRDNKCTWSSAVNIYEKIVSHSVGNNDENNLLTKGKSNIMELFKVPRYNAFLFIILDFIIVFIFLFSEIRDDQRFGIKFDCFSNAVLSLITHIIRMLLNYEGIKNKFINDPSNIMYKFNDYTKNGVLLFVFTELYIQLTSVIIPLIKCINAKKMDKKYANEPTNSMQYFYKILNSPTLVEELKNIAIQEFVVENVLFWENYCTLHKLVARAKRKHENNRGYEGSSNVSGGDRYRYGYGYMHEYGNHSSSSPDDESYDPNFPLIPQLVPYFNSFYHTFIDINGPAAVNITGDCIRRIYHDFYTYPTVGIFDEAKDEVVESMYFSIFPCLLQQNRRQLGNILH
ncbi:hypothetical protein BCR32DRAFT_328393 [Anaeromyces robustus]|uniref:RGS domain-containing protein n=1 Tax=Anaeromyces robustus TaxID=1754192 RepID=A0A1Y1WZN0_9FUNG|nr:hypothetical protein BCR32DRAFT_328393 [Anaeromyces robustus]|eukprot:ORX78808.1 hypothetical protein BCR32DRAFT_328393 [Anaeromyces robustus]